MGEIGLYEAMSTLRAVRRLRPDPIEPEVLRRVLEAATWAPSGGNLQPWRLVVVTDRERKQRLALLYQERWNHYAAERRRLLAAAPDAVREGAERMLRAGDHLADHLAEVPALVVVCFDPGGLHVADADLGRVSVVGGASIYPAVQNLLLACRAEGLGCVLTTLLCECEAEVRALLEVPDPWATAAAVPIGRPLLRGHGPLGRRPVEEMAFSESFGRRLELGAPAQDATS